MRRAATCSTSTAIAPSVGGPILVYLHGGAFRSGRKSREARPLIYRLASQGWVCISANYRLSPAAKFPDHLIDVKKVIAWAREHGAEYGADPACCSSPGVRRAVIWRRWPRSRPNDPAFQPGFERADTSVTGAISLYGYYGPIDSDRHSRRRRRRTSARMRRRSSSPMAIRTRSSSWKMLETSSSCCASCLVESGRLRRATRSTAPLRPLPLDSLRHGGRCHRGLHRGGCARRVYRN